MPEVKKGTEWCDIPQYSFILLALGFTLHYVLLGNYGDTNHCCQIENIVTVYYHVLFIILLLYTYATYAHFCSTSALLITLFCNYEFCEYLVSTRVY